MSVLTWLLQLLPDELLQGVGLSLVLRGPWIAHAWQAIVPRFGLQSVISVGYELLIDPNGWQGGRDVWHRTLWYGVTEAVIHGPLSRLLKADA